MKYKHFVQQQIYIRFVVVAMCNILHFKIKTNKQTSIILKMYIAIAQKNNNIYTGKKGLFLLFFIFVFILSPFKILSVNISLPKWEDHWCLHNNHLLYYTSVYIPYALRQWKTRDTLSLALSLTSVCTIWCYKRHQQQPSEENKDFHKFEKVRIVLCLVYT